MSKRSSIAKALCEKLKTLDGSLYTSNINNNCYPYLKFWDEVADFPSIYLTTGTETREYLPGDFKWGYLAVSLKVYCKSENSQQELEQLLDDIEKIIDSNNVLQYDQSGYETTEISITSIVTDEGLLAPYSIGEINLQIRYQIL